MPGRSFVQIPGPSNVPERVQNAMHRAMLDHRGQEFAAFTPRVLGKLKTVFNTQRGTPLIFPSSGTGALESSLVNVFSPGEHLLGFNIGYFSESYLRMAQQLGLHVDEVVLPWGSDIPPEMVQRALEQDREHRIKAVFAIHNETATGVMTDLAGIRGAIDAAKHPALLVVDTISGLGCLDFQFDAWGIDVAVTGSQKGLMLPPGLGLICVSARGLREAAQSTSRRSYFDWGPVLELNSKGFFPYTPATSLLFGLNEALDMLLEQGLPQVVARHARLAGAVRRAVAAWGLQTVARHERSASNVLTAVRLPEGVDGASFLGFMEQKLRIALGAGLGPLRGHGFRIGHLGWLGEAEVLATLAGIEMGLHKAGVKLALGTGVAAAQAFLLAGM